MCNAEVRNLRLVLFSATVLANSRADILRHALDSLCVGASESHSVSFNELQLVARAQRAARVLSALRSFVQVASKLLYLDK